MTPEEAEHYASILKHLGDSATFRQILGLRYSHCLTHNFAFGTFDDFVWRELGVAGCKMDGRKSLSKSTTVPNSV